MLLEPSDDWSCSGRVCSGGGSGLRIIGVGDDCGWRRPAFSFPERLVVGWLGASFKGFFLRLKATMATRACLGYYADLCRLRRAAADSAMTNGQEWQHTTYTGSQWTTCSACHLTYDTSALRSLVHLGLGSRQKCCTERRTASFFGSPSIARKEGGSAAAASVASLEISFFPRMS